VELLQRQDDESSEENKNKQSKKVSTPWGHLSPMNR
jgi:hypothetical protein